MIGISVAVLAVSCVRDPEPALCPQNLDHGDLVVTEFRVGPQSEFDDLRTWVELYNASGASVDLEGIKIRFRKKDGSSEVPVIVRRSLSVQSAGYAVLGLVADDANRPAHIDYGFQGDFHVGFLPAAAVDVEACGQRIDRAVYDVLPDIGTHSFGITPPDADANDVPVNWCVNATSAGTPQQANPACP